MENAAPEIQTPETEDSNINWQKGKGSQTNAIALPVDVSAMLANRKTRMKITLNDQVDQIHLRLYSEPEYQHFLDAVYNENSVEGSLHADDFSAAIMIRDHAREEGSPYVAGQNLATIVKSLNVVLRRYGMSRKERREA